MDLPFSRAEFIEVFKAYNEAVFPLPIVFTVLAAVALFGSFRVTRWSALTAMAILSLFWLWVGFGYHIAFFSKINAAANIFGILFILQGLFLHSSVGKLPSSSARIFSV